MPERRTRPEEWREYRHHNGETLAFRFIRSSRRTIALYVHRDGSVMVRAPMRAPFAEIYLFMRERWEWMQSQRTRFLAEPVSPPFSYRNGEPFLHLGEQINLRVSLGRRSRAQLRENELQVAIPPERLTTAEGLVDIVEFWQRREASRVFPLRLAHCHELMRELNIPFPELKIRKMRSRWGSCSRNAVITLNLELVRMPLECIDYVIIHELCHLVEFNHSSRFYDLQSRFLPDWKERRQCLDRLARGLYSV